MARWYPSDLTALLTRRYPPERVHSIVVITKFPGAVLGPELAPVLAAYDQVMVQVTVTGLGGTEFEPGVPAPEEALARLSDLMDFTGHPERVIVRIDPIIHWRAAGGGDLAAETIGSNQPLFDGLVSRVARAGIRRVKTSLASPYPKVRRRLAQAGLELVELTGDRREAVLTSLEAEAKKAGVRLEFCCEPSRPRSACVDPALLTRLHPRGLAARHDRARGQRETCGCAHAIDLAWYSTHPCPSMCLYCYANPGNRPVRPGPDPGEGGPTP